MTPPFSKAFGQGIKYFNIFVEKYLAILIPNCLAAVHTISHHANYLLYGLHCFVYIFNHGTKCFEPEGFMHIGIHYLTTTANPLWHFLKYFDLSL